MNDKPTWQPATISEVMKIVEADLAHCNPEQRRAFETHSVELHYAPIVRYGEMGHVVVIPQRGKEVIYWEDYEEGFNLSLISSDGRILEHTCNQDELGFALNAWVDGRGQSGRFEPAEPIDLK